MADDPDVGSLAEETLKLLAALGSGEGSEHAAGSCPHGWCPLCRVVEYLMASPELMEDATAAIAKVTSGLMELVKVLHPDMTNE